MTEQEAIEGLRQVRAVVADLKAECQAARARIAELERELATAEARTPSDYAAQARRAFDERDAALGRVKELEAERDNYKTELHDRHEEWKRSAGQYHERNGELVKELDTALAAKVAAERILSEAIEACHKNGISEAERDDLPRLYRWQKESLESFRRKFGAKSNLEALDAIDSTLAQLTALREDAAALREAIPLGVSREDVIESLRESYDMAVAARKLKDHSFVRWPDMETILDFIEEHGLQPKATAAVRTQEGT